MNDYGARDRGAQPGCDPQHQTAAHGSRHLRCGRRSCNGDVGAAETAGFVKSDRGRQSQSGKPITEGYRRKGRILIRKRAACDHRFGEAMRCMPFSSSGRQPEADTSSCLRARWSHDSLRTPGRRLRINVTARKAQGHEKTAKRRFIQIERAGIKLSQLSRDREAEAEAR